jgi:hypothetical protein
VVSTPSGESNCTIVSDSATVTSGLASYLCAGGSGPHTTPFGVKVLI